MNFIVTLVTFQIGTSSAIAGIWLVPATCIGGNYQSCNDACLEANGYVDPQYWNQIIAMCDVECNHQCNYLPAQMMPNQPQSGMDEFVKFCAERNGQILSGDSCPNGKPPYVIVSDGGGEQYVCCPKDDAAALQAKSRTR